MKKKAIITSNIIRVFIFNKNLLLIFSLPFVLGFILYYFGTSKFSVCPLMNLTHIPCPTCGLSRAFVELTHLHLLNAIEYNIFILMLAPIFFLIIIVQLLPLKLKKIIYKLCIKNITIIRIFIFVFAFIFFIHGAIRIIDHFSHFWGFKDLTPEFTLLKMIKKAVGLIFGKDTVNF